ncbi:MAG: hypothetical protein AAGB97_04140 [Dehalococcoidia bacterium]|nr:hypothetical protein [Chloroflexota bacterium]
MKFATMTEDGKILLPEEVVEKLKSSRRFAVIEDGERVILNPIRIPDVDEIAKRVKSSSPPTLEEISEEVHQYRKEKGTAW